MLLSKHLRLHSRFTLARKEPSSSANRFNATTTKICSQCPSTSVHTDPSIEHCYPLTTQRDKGFGSLVTTGRKTAAGNSSITEQQPSSCLPAPDIVTHSSIPSIFRRARFGRYVATRFLADTNLHGHRPTVITTPPRSRPSLRPLIPTPGSSLVAHHAYHSMPTSNSLTKAPSKFNE